MIVIEQPLTQQHSESYHCVSDVVWRMRHDEDERQVNRQSGAGSPAERFAVGRKICEANAPLQTAPVERMVMCPHRTLGLL
jgi:hypothetical protein